MRHLPVRLPAVAMSAAILIALVVAAFSSVAAREAIPGASNDTLPISSVLRDETGDIGTFHGTISGLAASGTEETRAISGLLNGRAVVNGQTLRVTDQAFSSRVTTSPLTSAGMIEGLIGAGSYAFSMQTAADPGKCDVLYLDVQSITLNLLGLEVQTSQIRVDINAIPGEENILGNLVCPAGAADGSPAAVATENAATATMASAAEGTPASPATATSVVDDLVGTEEPGTVSPTPTT